MVMRPLGPSEQATAVMGRDPSSYFGEYVSVCVVCTIAGRASARAAAANDENFILVTRTQAPKLVGHSFVRRVPCGCAANA